MARSSDHAGRPNLRPQQQGRQSDATGGSNAGYDPQAPSQQQNFPGQYPAPDQPTQPAPGYGSNQDVLAGYHYPTNHPAGNAPTQDPQNPSHSDTPAPFEPTPLQPGYDPQYPQHQPQQDQYGAPYAPGNVPGDQQGLNPQLPGAAPGTGYQDPHFPNTQPPTGQPGGLPPTDHAAPNYADVPQTAPPSQQTPSLGAGGLGGHPQQTPPYSDPAAYPTDPAYPSAQQPHNTGDPNTGWPQQNEDPFGAPGPDPRFDAPQQDPHAYAPGYADQAPQGHAHFDGDPAHQHLEPAYEDDDEYEDDEPSGFSRIYLIGGVLAAAIAVGGGLAYAYKVMLGPDPKVGDAPVVLGSKDPTKTRPDQPGGRKFDHTDSKMMSRLGDGGAKSADGSRRVPTVTVGPDGTIVPPEAGPTANSGGATSISVPGLTVVDDFGNQAAPTNQEGLPQQAASDKPIVVKPPGQDGASKPVVISNVNPTTNPQATTNNPAAAPTKPAPTTTAATPKPNQPAPTTSSSSGAGGAAGYVAVLASVPVSSSSRMDALAQYADLQQKYASLLKDKTPDVREANLGARGRYHRLLVGPPSSRAQASGLCTQLKSAGYSGCWVTAY